MKFLKNWIIDLILTIIFIAFGILLLIPDISTKIVSILVAALLIVFYVLVIVPKYSKIKSISTELVTWIILESIIIIALAVVALINQQTSVDLYIITLNLSDIIGLVFILEGIIGLIKITNNLEINKKLFLKYLYIFLIVFGTYIFSRLNISSKNISIGISILCFIISIVTLIYMFKFLPKNKKPNNLQ